LDSDTNHSRNGTARNDYEKNATAEHMSKEKLTGWTICRHDEDKEVEKEEEERGGTSSRTGGKRTKGSGRNNAEEDKK